jgi:glycosyltransferase involved in cell wall biosynthesis
MSTAGEQMTGQATDTSVTLSDSAVGLPKPKVAIVVTHPIQHFCPLYRALSSSGRITLRVLFASTAGQQSFYDPGFGQIVRFQDDLTSGFDHEFLPGHLAGSLTGKIKNARVGERLAAFDPDVLQVYGYHHPLSRDSMRWARAANRPVLYCSDSELLTPRGFRVRALKRMILPRIFAGCDGFLTVGDCNEAYYRHYGVAPDRFFRCPFPIDEVSLSNALRARREARSLIAQKLNLPGNGIFALTVGKLTTRKAVDQAIAAVSKTWESGLKDKLFLIVAGNGPEKERLEALARSLPVDAVRFAGFVEVSQLPIYYAAADLLIHPSSQDPHPLATSEAVFCGLPVVVSDRVGSAGPTDDVRIGTNGLRYAYGDVRKLAEILTRLCSSPDEMLRMREASTEIGAQRTLRASVDAYLAAVTTVLARKC